MSKNPTRNYAIQWLQRGQTVEQAAATAAAVIASSPDATGDVFGDVSGSLLGPLIITGLLGYPVDGPPEDGETIVFDLASGTWLLATPGGSGLSYVSDGTTTVAPVSALAVPEGGVKDEGSDLAYLRLLTQNYGEQHLAPINLAAGSTATIDCSAGNVFVFVLTANCTFTITNPPPAADRDGNTLASQISVILIQGGSGSYTVTWPASVKWRSATGTNSGSAPTLFTAVGAQDVIELGTFDGGTTWGGTALGGGTSGTVTSVALTVPAEFSIVGSPVTASGTLAITKATETANTVWAGPMSGSAAQPAFRALTVADIPAGVTAAVSFTVIGQETRISDGSTTTYLLDNDYDDNSVQAFNLTSGKALVVTENGTNSVTIGAAGTAGDSLAFAYAALAA